jgi:hypothetical protein
MRPPTNATSSALTNAMMRRTTLLRLKLRLEFFDREADYRLQAPESYKGEKWEMVMALALEINMVLWLMIGCATVETVQLVERLH